MDGEHEFEDSGEHFAGQTDGVDVAEQFGRVVVEHGCRFGLVDIEAVPDNRFVGVVGASLLTGSIEDPLHQRFVVGSGEVQHEFHIDIVGDQFTLGGIAWDPIQQQDLSIRVEGALGGPGGELVSVKSSGTRCPPAVNWATACPSSESGSSPRKISPLER